MKYLFLFFLSFSLFGGEPPRASKERIIDKQENFFQTSTTYSLAPHVNPIIGDLLEEETDFVVAGSSPLSSRRFLCPANFYNPRYGGWDYNPESYLVANLEYESDFFAALGSFDGTINLLKPSAPWVYSFKPSGGFIRSNGHFKFRRKNYYYLWASSRTSGVEPKRSCTVSYEHKVIWEKKCTQ